MVCEDSDLYREHPDWAFTIPGRKPVRARYQLVLDYSRKEVVDGIFAQIAKVLDDTKADYVKMDMNRHLTDIWSKTAAEQNQGAILHRYVLGVYDLLERFLAACPDLLLEGCSGGGGRYDAGMMYYSPQIWCSDNTDAINRLSIQSEARSSIRSAPLVPTFLYAEPSDRPCDTVPDKRRCGTGRKLWI